MNVKKLTNELPVFNDILHGALRPWKNRDTSERQFTRMLAELSKPNDSSEFTTILIEIESPSPINEKTAYYHELIQNTSIQYLNTIDKLFKDNATEIELKAWIDSAVHKRLLTLLRRTAKTIDDRKLSAIDLFTPKSHNFHTISEAFVLQHLKFTIIRLILELQSLYPEYLIKKRLTINEIFRRHLHANPPNSFIRSKEPLIRYKYDRLSQSESTSSEQYNDLLTTAIDTRSNYGDQIEDIIKDLTNYLFIKDWFNKKGFSLNNYLNQGNDASYLTKVKSEIVKHLQEIKSIDRQIDYCNEVINNLQCEDLNSNFITIPSQLSDWLHSKREIAYNKLRANKNDTETRDSKETGETEHIDVKIGDFREPLPNKFTYGDIKHQHSFQEFEKYLVRENYISPNYDFIKKRGRKKELAAFFHSLIRQGFFKKHSFRKRDGFDEFHYRQYLDHRYKVDTKQEFRKLRRDHSYLRTIDDRLRATLGYLK